MIRSAFRHSPHVVTLTLAWLLCSGSALAMLLAGTRSTGELELLRYAVHAAYSAALIWYLVRSGPSWADLPAVTTPRLLRWRGGVWLPAIVVALAFALALADEGGADIAMLLLILGTVGTLFACWQQIRLRWILQGVLVAVVAYIVGRIPAANGFISERAITLLAGFAAPMYLAGAIIRERTGLGKLSIADWELATASKSWLWGLALFLPMGMVNAAAGSPGGELEWVSEWWMPVVLPWFSGLTEEVWFRLLMVGLVYVLIRPALSQRPVLAAVLAVTVTAMIFGLGHGYSMERLVVTGLLYGLPLAVVFTKRDWEHAVGGHYMINAIPWLMAFLEH